MTLNYYSDSSREYMEGGRDERVEGEIILSWQPVSYCMPMTSSPMRTFSTRGIDLFVLTWDTVTEGVSLCKLFGGMGIRHVSILWNIL